MSLREKTLQAVFWLAAIRCSNSAVSFLTILILARLLAPTNFGLVAIAYLVINTVRLFSDLGLSKALIYRKDDIQKAADAAFVLIPVMNTVLFALVFLGAPYIAIFFNDKAMGPLVRVMVSTLVIYSLGTVPSALLEKELEFKKIVLPSTLSNIGYALVSILLAFAGLGVWSIALGYVFQSLLQTLLIWVVSPWRPTFKFDKRTVSEILGYGKYVVSVSLGTFLMVNLDNAFAGKLLGPAALGHYNLAFQIGNFYPPLVITLVREAILPACSKIQDKHQLLRKVFLETFSGVLMIAIPISIVMAIFAEDFIRIFYGKDWEGAILPLRILSFYGLIRSVMPINANIFLVTNKLKWWNYIAYSELLLFISLGYPVTTLYGLGGLGLLVTSCIFLGTVARFVVNGKILDIGLVQYLYTLKTPAIAALASACVILIARVLLPFQPSVLTLIIHAALFFACYVGLLLVIDNNLRRKVKTASLYELSRLLLK